MKQGLSIFPPLYALPSPQQAEVIAAAWESFSALLFISAVVPAVFSMPWPALLFVGSMTVSAALGPLLIRRGLFTVAGAIRTGSWFISACPLVATMGTRVLVAALAFGLMAGGMRRALYARVLDDEDNLDPVRSRRILRDRLAESSMMAGIVGGHVMMLFAVAFLRARSQILFKAWLELVPILAVIGTAGFTVAMLPATRSILRALEQGPNGNREAQMKGLAQALGLPERLAYVNFGVWSLCTVIGVVYGNVLKSSSSNADAVLHFALGLLFASGVSFYQRAWHRDAVAPAVGCLRLWTGSRASPEAIPLRRRMLRDFGWPLLFTGTLSLFSSVALYRTLATQLDWDDAFNAITALIASFAILVIAVGGVVVRAARELSRPMTELAGAADLVAHGQLDAAVPEVIGPIEVVGLGESIERMRVRLARTIGELERERAGLEANVEARTAELRRALAELRQTQAALIQGERLASIGELVSGVAHEIYNPLNAIAGASEALAHHVTELRRVIDAYRVAEAELAPSSRRALEELRRQSDVDASLDDLVGISTVVRRATDRCVHIVTNLRNFSRVSRESLPADLHAGLDETLTLLGPRLRQSQISVTKRYGTLPPIVCRAGEMNQVFMNLLMNSIQALEELYRDGLEDLPAGEITIETSIDAAMAVVAITDNGKGVPDEIARRIFDPFFTTKPRGEGTGLGLSISTDIVRRHGGTITLEPRADGGARFVCRIPVGRKSDPAVWG
jgi:signal transduction histidine kinase